MKKYYYTTDTDETINENARISFVEADTEEEALGLILKEFMKTFILDRGEVLSVGVGEFGDCWIISSNYNGEGCEPFLKEDLNIKPKGSHPGGYGTWITPYCAVYVPLIK